MRSVTGCLPCRARKIKCDETPGECKNCERYKEKCIYVSGKLGRANVNSLTESTDEERLTKCGYKRRRGRRSCNECKRAKSRCSGQSPCERCVLRQLQCVYLNSGTRPTYERNGRGSANRNSKITKVSSRESISETRETSRFSEETDNEASNNALWSRKQPTSDGCADSDTTLDYLLSEQLPSITVTLKLVDYYFRYVHSVRCLGFIHVPSFMERLQSGLNSRSEGNALLHVICALAAPFYAADNGGKFSSPNAPLYHTGRGWAKTALQMILGAFGHISVNSLMSCVLLHEYYLRVGEYSEAFLTSGLIFRMVQVLQLNIEYDFNILCQGTERQSLAPATKESRRRLMWACYLLDAFIEVGTDELRLISPQHIRVQLPCDEERFVRDLPCVTETLEFGHVLSFVKPEDQKDAFANMDMRAFYIRILSLRAKILRFQKSLDSAPWDSASEFFRLEQELLNYEKMLPVSLSLTKANQFIYKNCGRSILFYELHLMINQTFCDLYRLGLPKIIYPYNSNQWILESAPKTFLNKCSEVCWQRAVYSSQLLFELFEQDPQSLLDIPIANHLHEFNRLMIASFPSQQSSLSEEETGKFYDLVRSNIMTLNFLRLYFNCEAFYASCLFHAREHNLIDISDFPSCELVEQSIHRDSNDAKGLPPQFSVDYVLNSVGTFPLTRQKALDRHAPQDRSEFMSIHAITSQSPSNHSLYEAPKASNASMTSFNLLPSSVTGYQTQSSAVSSTVAPQTMRASDDLSRPTTLDDNFWPRDSNKLGPNNVLVNGMFDMNQIFNGLSDENHLYFESFI